MQINITIDDRIIHLIKRSKLTIVTVSLFLIAGAALYASTSLQWTDFQPGDVISASELNSRFNGLRDGLNAIGGTDEDGSYRLEKVNGEYKKVYTEHFTGTTPSSAISALIIDGSVDWNARRVLTASMAINHSNSNVYFDLWRDSNYGTIFIQGSSGRLAMSVEGGSMFGQSYRATIRWYKD